MNKDNKIFICPNCSYNTLIKSRLETHVKNKVCEGKKYICPDCEKPFQNKSNLNKHYKTIHNNIENPQVKVGSGSIDQSHLNNNSDHPISIGIKGNHNVVLIINPFGKENLDFMTDEYFLKFLEFLSMENCNGIIKIMADIHFHKDRPENHNVCMTDIRKHKINYKNEEGSSSVEGTTAKNFVKRFMISLGNIIKMRYTQFKSVKGVVEPFELVDKGVWYQSVMGIEDLIEKSEKKEPTSEDLKDFYEVLYRNRKKVKQFIN